jgi:hypothetical protein
MSRFTMDYLCKCGHRAKVKRDTRDSFPASLVCPYCTDVLKPTAGGPVVNFDVQPQVNPCGEDNAGFVQDYLCRCGNKHTSYRERGNRFPDHLACIVCGLYEGLKKVDTVIDIGKVDEPQVVLCEKCVHTKGMRPSIRLGHFCSHYDAFVGSAVTECTKVKTVAQEAWDEAVGTGKRVCLCDTCEHHMKGKDRFSQKFCAGLAKLVTPKTKCHTYRVSPKEADRLAREAFKADPRLPVFGGLDVKNKTLGVTLPPGWSITVKQES